MHDHFYIRNSRASLFDKQHGNRCSHKILIYNFTCEITKLSWQPSVRLSVEMATKF